MATEAGTGQAPSGGGTAVCQRPRAGTDPPRSVSFQGRKLACIDLHGADLSGGDLFHTKLDYTDLAGAKLSGGRLIATVFIGASLASVDVKNAVFEHSDFRGTAHPPDAIAVRLGDNWRAN